MERLAWGGVFVCVCTHVCVCVEGVCQGPRVSTRPRVEMITSEILMVTSGALPLTGSERS